MEVETVVRAEVTANTSNPDNRTKARLILFISKECLQVASLVGQYTMWNVMTYLTDVWKLDITHAAAIVNLYWGFIGVIISIAMKFLDDTIMGNYWMLLISNLAYCCGLWFLTMSTPPVLAGAIGNCSAYEPRCVGDEQIILFFIGLALTAVGISGQTASQKYFFAEQVCAKSDEDGSLSCHNLLCNIDNPLSHNNILKYYYIFVRGRVVTVTKIIVTIVAPYLIHHVVHYVLVFAIISMASSRESSKESSEEWSHLFGVPAICFALAIIFFLIGSPIYNYAAPQGSPLTSFFRVFVAAASKMFYSLPSDPDQLYEERELVHLVPHTRTLRWLDKGAIIVQQNEASPSQNQESRWRLCRVTEIEETKMLVRLIPICMTFIMCGVVLSIGDTYFIEQANDMDDKVGNLHVPIQVLLGFYNLAKYIVSKLGKTNFRFEIPASMIFSILCCITAAKVEARRLDIVRSLNLLDDPDEIIPMTIFWLAPQFLLLGGLSGLSKAGFIHFFKHHIPQSMRDCYSEFFAEAVLGVGYFGAVLSVYVVGKISERGGTKPSWFQDTLNNSRLDNYYWTLAAMGAVNLILYILASIWHGSGKVKESEDKRIPEDNGEDGCFC